MESTLCFSQRLQSALADGLSRAAGRVVPPSDIHMPARAAAAGSPAAIRLGLDAARLADELSETLPFPEVFGVQPVARVRAENRWLLFDLSDAWYAAAAGALIAALPPAEDDCGSHALNRMRALARRGGAGCPACAPVQRALFLTMLLLPDGAPPRRAEAERALLSMAHGLPPRERAGLLSGCGAVGEAAARVLYALYRPAAIST